MIVTLVFGAITVLLIKSKTFSYHKYINVSIIPGLGKII